MIARACLCATLALAAAAATNRPGPSVGIEGLAEAVLPRPDYRPRDAHEPDELILRLERVEPAGSNAWRYVFGFIGLEPRAFDLAASLVRPDGSPAPELTGIPVRVTSVLPRDDDGRLPPLPPRALPALGGYRVTLVALAILWLAGLLAVIRWLRPRAPAAPPPPAPPEPTLAERLRPLVEAAGAGTLTADGQARLERLLLAYWRTRIHLPPDDMIHAVTALKAHPEAGVLLRAVERWLHSREGAGPDEVRDLLAPYASAPPPESAP